MYNSPRPAIVSNWYIVVHFHLSINNNDSACIWPHVSTDTNVHSFRLISSAAALKWATSLDLSGGMWLYSTEQVTSALNSGA